MRSSRRPAPTGQLTYSFEAVDVAAIAARCARLAGQISANHELVFERSGDTIVDGDEARLQEVFVNLIHKSIKYSPRGGTVTVRVRGAREHVTVTVADQGIGIHPEDAERIFDRLVRLKTGEGEGIEGTCLGLYIVRRIVEAHGGRMVADGRPGKGATFTVDLPRERRRRPSVERREDGLQAGRAPTGSELLVGDGDTD